MINWRTSQNYLLLFAIAFKTLILGTVLTLATHNICLGQLLNDDINWAQIVGKQRKRNDDHSSHALVYMHTAIVPKAGGDVWTIRSCMLPALFFAWLLAFPRRNNSGRGFIDPLLRYMPDKIFIRHCAILR
jgi:hypothetical protein